MTLYPWRQRPITGAIAFAGVIAFAFLIGDVRFTGKREVAFIACSTPASAAEQAVPCPFK
ncbi:MAG: hypothetical protein AAB480_01705 [Patescibacteria group bacterium]